MRHKILLLLIVLFPVIIQSQSNHYGQLWKTVEQFELDGLPKSALKIVDDISKQAIKDHNATQQIKALIYKSKFTLILEEDAQLAIINTFKTAISKSKFPKKNILENMLANLYWQYFKQNRYTFYNRTKTNSKVDVEDFRTWDLQTLFLEINNQYQKSLENGSQLQLEPLSHYDDILSLQKDSKLYRPTLFDFLNHNALEFYTTNETSITKPAYKFEIDDPEFLCDAFTFSNLELQSKDSSSLQLQALKIYQDLIKFHIKDQNALALADVDLERLNFVNQNAVFSNKESLLLETLIAEAEKLKPSEVSGLYEFEIASIYYQQGQQYQPKTNEGHRWKTKDAYDLCNQVISKFPNSKGAEKCIVLKQQIEQAFLQITTENFLPIQQHARLLVRYKNLDSLQLKVYQLTRKQLEQLNNTYKKEGQLDFIKTLGIAKEWKSPLRNEHDYQTHSTEILIPKLNNGTYLIVASPKKDDDIFAYSTVQVTNLALVETETEDHKTLQVIDRNNGKPIANTEVELRYNEYNSKSPQSDTFYTNSLGEITIDKTRDRYRNISAKVKYGTDTAYFGDYYVNKHFENKTKETDYKAFLFTDRSIYRPGQTVYFKAIAMKAKNGKAEVVANEPVYATLYDANDQEIKKLEFKTNIFGSVSGEFILPNSGLNGNYHVEFDGDENDFFIDHYFSVEDYKRPKFKTTFNPVTKTYKVNDTVTVKGTTIAYAGSFITNANVVYRVHRKVIYPDWYFWYRPYFYSEPQEIKHGESLTNDKGEFEITFKAIPDTSIDKSSLPIFNYEITADVTDLNGETRSATTIVKVGYHALVANMSIDKKLDKTKKGHQINIDTKNLNGEWVPATGIVKIFKLKAPNHVLRTRPWEAPDYQEFSEAAFKNLFPHDAYTNEDNSSNLEKSDLVFEKPFDTKTSKELALGKLKNWQSGQYLITLESKDKFGQLVKDEIKTTLYSDADKTIADQQLFSITTNKPTYKAGDNVLITLASAADNLNVTVMVEKDHKVINTQIIHLNNNKKTFSVPVTTEDIGGFAINYNFAAFNSFESGTEPIVVPYPKTDLNIKTATFRDKLQPGTEETWSFKIQGPQGEKVSAELLASMYDASLDQFKPHTWEFNPIDKPVYYSYNQPNANRSFGTKNFRVYNDPSNPNYLQQLYDQLNWFGFYFGRTQIMIRGVSSISKNLNGIVAGVPMVEEEAEDIDVPFAMNDSEALEEVVTVGYGIKKEKSSDKESFEEKPNFDNIQIRKNLQETAFFFPQLQTDKDGNVSFNFTTPEALTQWKIQLLAHTKTLESATKTLTTVTQKELMVIPNAPRFLREGDQITISAKIANLTDKELSGQAILLLTDDISNKDITSKLISSLPSGEMAKPEREFTVNANGNTQVSWSLSIPDDVDAVQYKIIAKSGNYSDGEQNALPVLSNRILVTETLPMWVHSNETKTFSLDKLKTNTSTTIKSHKLTLEITSNPAWYAVQALPYLMEYPYECNEQTFSRYYANALARHIVNSNPRIQNVFNQWKSSGTLISNLENNEELKAILIQETPWLRDAQSETEQKKRIALLFDLNKMNNELELAIGKLGNNQMDNGAWPWFQGGQDSRYITQHIIAGFGHLSKLGVISTERGTRDDKSHNQMIEKAINYLDDQFVKEYKDIRKYDDKVDLTKDHLSNLQLHYLYMRSFYPEIKKSKEVAEITQYYQTQIQHYWLNRSLYAKGLMALISERVGDATTSKQILKSLKENSITSDELGMYWKENTSSWYWYQAPIETQALMIEAFSEIGTVIQSEANNLNDIDNLKIWLLKNKQTNQWKTTKATTEAVYALLLQGSDWLSVTNTVDVVVGKQNIEPSKLESVKLEAGSGYLKTSWNASEIKPDMADITLTKKGDGNAWGSLYWQYFEDLDKITSAETPLTLKKKLFLKTNTDTGEQISEITPNTQLRIGDLVRVRIELRSDRAMEFIHMKDMRAAGLEPVNVLSQYKWQDGLGYYESTKDASTNFFFDYLPKGVYVFEYDLRVNNAGNMSNGITTIQSMYAPEFSSHSKGTRLLVR